MKQKQRRIYVDSVNKRKKEVHFTHKLKSGKTAHLWLYKWERHVEYDGSFSFSWQVGFIVADSAKEARRWFRNNNGKPSGIRGDGSIEALAWAYRTLETFVAKLPPTQFVIVEAEDQRRLNAYRYLARKGWRYDGFDEVYFKYGTDCKKSVSFFLYPVTDT